MRQTLAVVLFALMIAGCSSRAPDSNLIAGAVEATLTALAPAHEDAPPSSASHPKSTPTSLPSPSLSPSSVTATATQTQPADVRPPLASSTPQFTPTAGPTTAAGKEWKPYRHLQAGFGLEVPSTWEVRSEDSTSVEFQVDDQSFAYATVSAEKGAGQKTLEVPIDQLIGATGSVLPVEIPDKGAVDAVVQTVGKWEHDVNAQFAMVSAPDRNVYYVMGPFDADHAFMLSFSRSNSSPNESDLTPTEMATLNRVLASFWIGTFKGRMSQSDSPYANAVSAKMKQAANGRDGPGLNYGVIAKFKAGDVVTAIATDQTGAWYKLVSGPWVFGELLELSTPQRMPVATIAPSPTPKPSPTPDAMATRRAAYRTSAPKGGWCESGGGIRVCAGYAKYL